jgi:hypothetical protein
MMLKFFGGPYFELQTKVQNFEKFMQVISLQILYIGSISNFINIVTLHFFLNFKSPILFKSFGFK